jgi:filamentous hemagglutinin
MNKNLYRIVFNAARGCRMVVQETAASAGKGTSQATSVGTRSFHAMVAAVGLASSALWFAAPAAAQLVGASNAPGAQRPVVLAAPNGVPVANIATPSAAGVSRNVFSQFDVGANGAILANNRNNVQTQLGGWIQGNPFLANGPARIILNEVNSGNPSQLRGWIEVGGTRAEVIIANPAGIYANGSGFINASRATLTTGTPQLNAAGGLDSFIVRGGTVSIDGAGLDLRQTDYAAILARAVQINAGLWANELKVVTGANQVSADAGTATPTAGNGSTPVFSLDVAALGGMYAGKITLVGTEAGLGVRNAGSVVASGQPQLAGAGQLVVTAAGRLENTGSIQAESSLSINAASLANNGSISSQHTVDATTQGLLQNSGTVEGQRLALTSTAGAIDNSGGTLRQTSSAALDVAAASISNVKGVIGAEPVAAVAPVPSPNQKSGSYCLPWLRTRRSPGAVDPDAQPDHRRPSPTRAGEGAAQAERTQRRRASARPRHIRLQAHTAFRVALFSHRQNRAGRRAGRHLPMGHRRPR